MKVSGGDVVPGGSDFTIDSKGKTRTVKWLLDYPEFQMKYVGTIDDETAPGRMTGDVIELVGEADEVRVGSFVAEQLNAIEGKGTQYFAKPEEGKLKKGLDLEGRPRWAVEKELRAKEAAAASSEARAKNAALMEKYGCTDQASCVEALKRDQARAAGP